MKIKLFIFLCFFISSSINSYSQKKIRNKKLCPIIIDTLNEKILAIEKSSSIVYFKQSDIFEYLEENPDSILQTLLNQRKKKIYYRDFWWNTDYTKQEKENYFLGDFERKRRNKLFFALFCDVGADLISKGKFMVFDKASKKIISKKLRMKRIKHKLGQIDIHLNCPQERYFGIFS